jgi:hypothetical protein
MPMPPPSMPKKPKGIAIAIGIGKPKGGGMPPPKMPGADDAMPPDPKDDMDPTVADPAKMEKAGVIRADHHCQDCSNWEPDTGNCTQLGPGFAPDDACLRYFEEIEGEDEGSDDEAAEGEGEMPEEAMPAGGPPAMGGK